MDKILKQAIKFFAVSGTGWLIDFSVYIFLINKFLLSVSYANMISSIPAITFVFFISTKKIFNSCSYGVSLKKKYMIYFFYQMLLIYFVSLSGEFLYINLWGFKLFKQIDVFINLKILIKLIITPFTMLLNFIVMKVLSEKI